MRKIFQVVSAIAAMLVCGAAFANHTINLKNPGDMDWTLSGPTDQVHIGSGNQEFIITVDRINGNPNSAINVANCELPNTRTPVTTIIPGSESYCEAIDETQDVVLTTEGSQSSGMIQNFGSKKK